MPDDARPEIVYVGDPMCSWCWGFAPVLERLINDHDVDHRLILGGLRPGPAAQPLTDQLKSFLLHHWDQVAAASGQSFDRDALAARDATWTYDTELPAIAVAAMRSLAPHLELELFVALQQAFYADGIDITQPETYPPIIAGLGVDTAEFTRVLESDDSRRTAWDDFASARRLGATGFPTTLIHIGGRYRMLAAGFRPFAEVDQILHAVFDRFRPGDTAISAAACSIGANC